MGEDQAWWKCFQLQRVAPTEAGESAEVRVVGMHLCLVLYGQRSDMGVGHEVRGGAGRVEL